MDKQLLEMQLEIWSLEDKVQNLQNKYLVLQEDYNKLLQKTYEDKPVAYLLREKGT